MALIIGCGGRSQKAPGAESGQERLGLVKLTIDTAVVWAEVADRPETRQLGLMYRREMPKDQGMLFIFEEPQILDFWMKNTYLPLDIAFISSDGTILNIEAMKPLDDKPRYRSRGPARYALEVNQGWFAARGIGPGVKVKF